MATGADAALPLLGIIFLPCAMIMDMLTWTRGPATGPATDHPAARSARKSLRACGYPAPRGCPDERPGNEPGEVKRD